MSIKAVQDYVKRTYGWKGKKSKHLAPKQSAPAFKNRAKGKSSQPRKKQRPVKHKMSPANPRRRSKRGGYVLKAGCARAICPFCEAESWPVSGSPSLDDSGNVSWKVVWPIKERRVVSKARMHVLNCPAFKKLKAPLPTAVEYVYNGYNVAQASDTPGSKAAKRKRRAASESKSAT